MSLTTRFVLFFQVTLALILAAFSVLLFSVAYWYIEAEARGSVNRAVATLVASVDIEADSVEWEPSDREVALGTGPLGGTLYWYITDAHGAQIDRSPGARTHDLIASTAGPNESRPQSAGWQVSRRLIHPPGASGAQLSRDRTAEEIEKGEYPALVFTAGLRTAPLLAGLKPLAVGLASVSIVVWIAALAVGQWMCRQALRPVTDMANAAQQMKADEFNILLPQPTVRGELEELHSSMSGLLDRWRSALSRERRFTAEASHQLRTPLATILGQVEVLLRRPRTAEDYERVIGVIQRQARQMAGAVESLLFLARSENDANPPVLEALDLADWARQYVASLADHPRHADLVLMCDSAPLTVRAHPALLRELVHNLVDNALKYSPKDTAVTIQLSRLNTGASLSVIDEGSGVPKDDLPHLFEPFYRSAAAQRQGVAGSGLGLAVVARIASAFGCRIEVTSPRGIGSEFRVLFRESGGLDQVRTQSDRMPMSRA